MSKYRTKEEQEALCKAWSLSRLTQKEFCKKNNICKKTFWRWRSKFSDNKKIDHAYVENSIKSMPVKFLQVDNTTIYKSATNGNFLEINLPNGINFKANMPKNEINNFLQELLKWK